MIAKQFPNFKAGHLASAFARYFYIPKIQRTGSGRFIRAASVGVEIKDAKGHPYRIHKDGSLRHA